MVCAPRTSRSMQKLQAWMDKKGWCDNDVAEALRGSRKISRVQVSRIRRGITGTSVLTAKALAALTGIRWSAFVEVPAKPKKRA